MGISRCGIGLVYRCISLLRRLSRNLIDRFFSRGAEYSRKAEDILWRKSFYDVILLMRKNLKYIRPNSGLEGSVRTHIVAANGIYHGLLLKLQAQLDVVKVGGVCASVCV